MGVRLDGARVLLTGATGGVGQAIARRLSSEGAQLVLTSRRSDALRALADELGGQAIVVDLARREEVERLLAGAGEIDLLVANAALPGSGRLATLERDHVDRAIEVNLRAPIALAHGLVPSMLERGNGHLVFIGSLSGKAPNGGASLYSATKFGLRGFALALRAELAPAGIGVSLGPRGSSATPGCSPTRGSPCRGVSRPARPGRSPTRSCARSSRTVARSTSRRWRCAWGRTSPIWRRGSRSERAA